MHTMIGIVAYEDSEAQAKKATIKIGNGITKHYRFDYGVLLDKKATIIFGENYIKNELVLFDQLNSKADKDTITLGADYGMHRYKALLKALGIKAVPIISFETMDAFKILNFLLHKNDDMPSCPPTIFGPDAKPIRSREEFIKEARFDMKNPPYLVLMDVHFESTNAQMEYIKKMIDEADVEEWFKLKY